MKSTVIVGVMVVLSVGLSYILDRRSNRAVEIARQAGAVAHWCSATDGRTEIRISEVVPGDIVLLQAGSLIPADLRLLVAKDFFVSQSALSGRIDGGREER